MGLKWGLGFGWSVSKDDAVNDADIVNGVVREKSNLKQQPRIILEFHKYIGCNSTGTRGCGPFVAVAASNDNILSGVGGGVMYGFKEKAGDSSGFSIGLGAMLDAKVKDLADGFVEGSAPPDGETSIRYVEESRWSLLLFATRTF